MTVSVIGDNTGDDYSGTEDTELTESSATTNSQADTEWYVSAFDSGDRRHVCLAFSGISSLPSSLTVSSATAYIYHIAVSAVTTNVVEFRRLLRNWVENQATWNDYATSNSWTTGGALSDSNDRSATVTVSISPGTSTGAYDSASSAQLAADIEDFADGTLSNYGWELELEDDTSYAGYFDQFTSSKGTDGQRPYLSVTYTATGGVTVPVFMNHYRNQGIN